MDDNGLDLRLSTEDRSVSAKRKLLPNLSSVTEDRSATRSLISRKDASGLPRLQDRFRLVWLYCGKAALTSMLLNL